MRGERVGWGRLALMLGLALSLSSAPSALTCLAEAMPASVSFHLRVEDPTGRPLEVRARIRGSDGQVYPSGPDSSLQSHSENGGFFYVDGHATLEIPPGLTRVTVGRGFEWRAYDATVYVAGGDTLRVVLERFVDLRPSGWYSADLHVHSEHGPGAYVLTPAQLHRIACAEGLDVMQLLDDPSRVTGAPEPFSDSLALIVRSIEVRNQTYGHVSLPGLSRPVTDWCCQTPYPAFPMLYDLRQEVTDEGVLLALAHPHNTEDYWMESTWPGTGLGREWPVLAALGALDAFDVVSYNNHPNGMDWAEWYDLLSSGLAVTPTGGSDAILNWYNHLPAGGWRFYSQLSAGAPLNLPNWVESIRAGRTFVTNYPLIPVFEVGGRRGGETLEAPHDTIEVPVRIRALCPLGINQVRIVADGVLRWTWFGSTTVFDTSFVLRTTTPAWLAARVDGPQGHPHALVTKPIGHTNAILLTKNGVPRRLPPAAIRCIEAINRLETMVHARGNWAQPADADTFQARIDRARAYFAMPFAASPPSSFALRQPGPDEVVEQAFSWSPAADPDPGDSVFYRFSIAADSTFEAAWTWEGRETTLAASAVPLESGHFFWWRVEAVDRSGSVTRGTPSSIRARPDDLPIVGVPERVTVPVARATPVPSAAGVRLTGFTSPVTIYDLRGRRIADLGRGAKPREGALVWDGTTEGRLAPAGVYWAVGSDGRQRARLVLLR